MAGWDTTANCVVLAFRLRTPLQLVQFASIETLRRCELRGMCRASQRASAIGAVCGGRYAAPLQLVQFAEGDSGVLLQKAQLPLSLPPVCKEIALLC